MMSPKCLWAIILFVGCVIQFCKCLPVPPNSLGASENSRSHSLITNYRPSLVDRRPHVSDVPTLEKSHEFLPSSKSDENVPKLHYADSQLQKNLAPTPKHFTEVCTHIWVCSDIAFCHVISLVPDVL